MGKLRLTLTEFIERAKKVHKDKFDYSKVIYENIHTKVNIHCNTCGKTFMQTPKLHLHGQGCPYCRGHLFTKEDFIEKAVKIHGDKYDYTQVDFVNSVIPVQIYCKQCKKFFMQKPLVHIHRCGCIYCKTTRAHEKVQMTQEEFINKAKTIHQNKYDYSNVVFVNSRTKIKIQCNKTKEFFYQTPNNHLCGQGCPCCKRSKGEEIIKNLLELLKVNHLLQYKFKGCKDKTLLPFDFYLPDYNICVEFQGQQHYDPGMFISLCKSKEKGLKKFKLQQRHDKIKRKFCEKEGLHLLEISYNENIEEKLKNYLKNFEKK